MNRHFLPRNAFFLLGGILAVAFFSHDGVLSRIEGLVLVACYVAYLVTIIITRSEIEDEKEEIEHMSAARAWLILGAGLLLLLVSAELTVLYAAEFADEVGLSNMAVSAIVIGMGSSLPELSVSFVALLRKRGGLSVGNLVGSNVLDTLLVPGLAAAIHPLVIPTAVLLVDLPVLFVVTVLVLFFLYVTGRGIRSPEAALLLTVYIGYAVVRLGGPGS